MNRMAFTWARWVARRIGASYPMCRMRFLQTDACCSYARTHLWPSLLTPQAGKPWGRRSQSLKTFLLRRRSASPLSRVGNGGAVVSERGQHIRRPDGLVDRTGKLVEAVVDH